MGNSEAATSLTALGPVALPAVQRLLQHKDQAAQVSVLTALQEGHCTWALAAIANLIIKDNPSTAEDTPQELAAPGTMTDSMVALALDEATREVALVTATCITGKGFTPDSHENWEAARRRFIHWWKREGLQLWQLEQNGSSSSHSNMLQPKDY